MLAIDIGNSNVVMAIRQGDEWSHLWRINTQKDEQAELFYNKEIADIFFEDSIDTSSIEGVILSSVVPTLRPVFYDILTKRYDLDVTIVGPDLYESLSFKVPRPHQIGTDLVANAYAGYKKYGGKVSVVDFGTAMTITTVNDAGKILGVSIAPGIKTAMKALVANTAQLPDIPLELPESVLGNDTIHAMQAGILWGYVGMVKEMSSKIRSELSNDYKLIATGGLSFIMDELKEVFYKVDRNLTMDGLYLMWKDIKTK
tara:strand:+ start:1749 stop:2519 length:771 start_codon:yes stop_codon:yes gene_type:complete